MIDWTAYRTCGICRAGTGSPCTARYTQVVAGDPVGPPVELDGPHGFRKLRAGR